MGFIGVLLIVFLIISAVLLTLVILLQDEEGEGIGGLFSGGSSTPFGSRSGNILTKVTTAIAVIFIVCTFALAWLNRNPEVGNVIGKARAETLQTSQKSDWWISTEPAKDGAAAAEQPATPPAAQPENK